MELRESSLCLRIEEGNEMQGMDMGLGNKDAMQVCYDVSLVDNFLRQLC